ncbi:thermonuclease family protein [Thauera mechernichensis]|uniref:Thermonuclease family protein n=1 Tax=Thauera mechernichensis TaxID=82788 RepID=A0ABW3WIS3_9RHOO|nr:thermonuclease family protein [Thauera mechernichensis]MDG3066870.1 thermonuclease family protein [Thauera mechernichensis]
MNRQFHNVITLYATLLFAVGLALAAPVRAQQTATGPVTGVSDGDTFYMTIDGRAVRVRLAQIDAPEKAQPFGRRAEQSLRDLIGKRQVTVTWTQADQYGRPVVQAEADGVNVNAEQVRRGFAWAWPRYTTDPRLLDWQAEARAARRGLWADPNPVEPWVWRQVHRKGGR